MNVYKYTNIYTNTHTSHAHTHTHTHIYIYTYIRYQYILRTCINTLSYFLSLACTHAYIPVKRAILR